MSDIVIDVCDASDYDREHYGITFRGATQHHVTGRGVHNREFPHRIVVWDNTGRLNPHPGETRWTDHGAFGGDGQYLDPHNKATDSPFSVLLSSESVVIASHYTDQDIADRRQGDDLAIGDRVQLRYPDGEVSGEFEIVAGSLSDPALCPAE